MRELTVGDLRNALDGVDDNMKVHISYNYGDYWKTVVAPVATEAEEGRVSYSEYHRMDKIDEDGAEDFKKVFIIG